MGDVQYAYLAGALWQPLGGLADVLRIHMGLLAPSPYSLRFLYQLVRRLP